MEITSYKLQQVLCDCTLYNDFRFILTKGAVIKDPKISSRPIFVSAMLI